LRPCRKVAEDENSGSKAKQPHGRVAADENGHCTADQKLCGRSKYTAIAYERHAAKVVVTAVTNEWLVRAPFADPVQKHVQQRGPPIRTANLSRQALRLHQISMPQ
jgi:hypothetical protein